MSIWVELWYDGCDGLRYVFRRFSGVLYVDPIQ